MFVLLQIFNRDKVPVVFTRAERGRAELCPQPGAHQDCEAELRAGFHRESESACSSCPVVQMYFD